MKTYTENGYTGGSQTLAERKTLFDNYAQATANAEGEAVTINFLLPDGTYYTTVKYPSDQQPSTPQQSSSSSSNGTPINKDTTALIQRGDLIKPGYYGNQELKSSNDDFNEAVQTAAQLFGAASALKVASAPPNYTRTPTNYVLTDREKQAITAKSQQLSIEGSIPEDTLENFFYILAAVQNYNDLVTISKSIGVPDLADSSLLHNILGILALPDISNVAFLSQGVAAVIQTYGSQYGSISGYGNPSQSSIGSTLDAASTGLALGVVGASLISLAHSSSGYSGPYSGYPGLSSSNIGTAINTFASVAGGTASVAQLGAVSNPASSMVAAAAAVGVSAISSLLGQSPLGGALSGLGSLGGIAAGVLMSQSGGSAMGGLMSETILGTRLSTAKRANNPMLAAPSYAGKAFFGEAPVSLPATDQVFSRRIGAYGSTAGGNGIVSFAMQNHGSFGGTLALGAVVSQFLTGSPVSPSTSTFFGQGIAQIASNVASVLNVSTDSGLEMRRSDNSIPFLIGFSSAIVGETNSPYGSKTFMDGWKLAASTGNDIQRYNPGYLRAIRSTS